MTRNDDFIKKQALSIIEIQIYRNIKMAGAKL
jgi:hypothetical protein